MPKSRFQRLRLASDLARKKGNRPPYQRVLIVCEGSKTEPQYFEEIRKTNRVPTAHIRVINADGTQPKQVVDFAESQFLKSREFDWVFAVFDRDDHATYHEALSKAENLDEKIRNDENKFVKFRAIPSVPCFELWLLLHFSDIHAFHHRDEIFNRLRNCILDYSKGSTGVYQRTEPNLQSALSRAKFLQEQFNPHQGTEPYTNVDVVVELLRSIRHPKR